MYFRIKLNVNKHIFPTSILYLLHSLGFPGHFCNADQFPCNPEVGCRSRADMCDIA